MNAAAKPATEYFTYRNAIDLQRISYEEILTNTAEGVFVERPEVRIDRRRSAEFHEDPDGAELFSTFGEIDVKSPPVFVASLRNARLVGFRSLLSREGFFINDLAHFSTNDVSSFVKGLRNTDELAPLTPTDDESVFSLAENPAARKIQLPGPVVVLTSAEPGNFGSFLYRDLVKLIGLAEMPAHWRFLVYIGNESYEQFLQIAGLPLDKIVRHDPRVIYEIEQAIVPGIRNPFGFIDQKTQAFYESMRERCADGRRGRRLYVSRTSMSAARPKGRVMLNETELIERLRPLGFDIVEPQELTAEQQVANFASADLVVGPSGAGMFNTVFCRPGTFIIDIESEPHWAFPHSCLFASTGLRYGIFEGLATDRDWTIHHKPWRVNIEALIRRITAISMTEETTMSQTRKEAATPFWSIPRPTGEFYITVLKRFHDVFKPNTYLEIGVNAGATLELASCSSIAIDPDFKIEKLELNKKPTCHFFQTTSDNFFKKHDPSKILGQPIDIAFLDGLHWFEFLLRDFINVEAHCKPNSIIFMHDCIPTDEHVGRRDVDSDKFKASSPFPGWWAGDVWKVPAILQKYRPDLRLSAFNASDTGLIAITRLDPTSTLLSKRYWDLVEEYSGHTLSTHGDDYIRDLKLSTRNNTHRASRSLPSFGYDVRFVCDVALAICAAVIGTTNLSFS